MITNKLKIAILFAFISFSSLNASAQTLDQSNLPTITSVVQARNIDWQGQSFTAGLTGTLTSFSALIRQEPGVVADVDVGLFQIVNNIALVTQGVHFTLSNSLIPAGNIGGGQSYTLSDMMSIDLSPYHFQVTAGSEYAFVVHSSIGFRERPMINWFAGNTNGYTSGNPYGSNTTYDSNGQPVPTSTLNDFYWGRRDDFDHAFATFVSVTAVPEPETYALMLAGLGLLGAAVRRRKAKQA